MVCPFCGQETAVSNSRLQKRSNKIWRRRRCKACRAVFTTLEAPYLAGMFMIESEGSLKPLQRDVLFIEILNALRHRDNSLVEAAELTDTILTGLLKDRQTLIIRPEEISKAASTVIKRFDVQAWHRFSADHPSLLNG